ncbi:MAG: hypothetical protein JKY42_07035, partial [Flavobacteriales bacterium]|nr:hypothetical protein [Flavobacteriales bacterium]
MKKNYLLPAFAFFMSFSSMAQFIAPYTESFDGATTPASWVENGSEAWKYSTAAAYGAGFAGDNSGNGGNYAWIDGSTPNGAAQISTLTSASVDISGLANPYIYYWVFSNNIDDAGNNTLTVEVYDGAAWNVVQTLQANNLGWTEYSVDLSTLTITGNVQIQFTVAENSTGAPYYNDILVDDVSFQNVITCPAPSALVNPSSTGTTADIAWTENGSATSWQVEWGNNGFIQGAGTYSTASSNPHTLTGLSSSSTLDYYVRAVCGPADTSTWVGPFTFTTACGTFTAPFLEEFDLSSLPNCWTESGLNVWEYGSTSMGGFSAYGAANVQDHSASGTGTFIGMDGSNNSNGNVSILESPMVDLSPLNTPTFSYWVFSNNIDDGALNKLIVEVYDGAAWIVVDSIQMNLGIDWVERVTDLSSFTITGDVQARFTVTGDASGGSTFYNDILIDDVKFYTPPAIDISVISVDSPIDPSCGLSSAEDLTITIVNSGFNDTANFDLSYQIDGGTIITEAITSTLLSGNTLTHTFSTQADFSAGATYNIVAWVTLVNDGDALNDTVFASVTNNLNPIVNLGNDTTICDGVDLTIDAGAGFSGYDWDGGSANQTLVVNTSGVYSVTVVDANGCFGSDAMTVSTSSFVAPNLGSDTSICDGSAVTLDAGTYDTYLWGDGSTNQTLTVTNTGMYYVTVVEASTSCTAASTVFVEVIVPTSTFSMPNSFCEVDPAITLTATPFGGSFSGAGLTGNVFSPMAATPGNYDIIYDYSVSSVPTYSINQSGTFAPLAGTGSVINLSDDEVSANLPIGFSFDFFGVSYTDFFISSNGFISFQDDGSGCCSGQNVPDAGVPNNLIAFAWTDLDPQSGAAGDFDYLTLGIAPNRILVVNCNAVEHIGGASTVTAQVLLYEATGIIEIHTTDMPNDGGLITMGIENSDGTIGYGVPNRNASSTWGVTNDFVRFVPGPVTTCFNSDTVNVDVFPSPVLDLGVDTTICSPSTYVLDAGNTGSTYLWNDASTLQALSVSVTGDYAVTVTNPQTCVANDSIYILSIATPVINLGNDTVVCEGDTVTLDAYIPTATYLWSTGETTTSINVSTSGQYIVSVTKCGTVVDTINVTVTPLPAPDLGPDLFVCYNDTVTLDAGAYAAYNWEYDLSAEQFLSDTISSCDFSLEMYDSFGDGWNSAYVEVFENGVPIAQLGDGPLGSGFNAGSGPQQDAFTVTNGSILDFVWAADGSFPTECSFNIFDDGANNLFFQDNGATGTPVVGSVIFSTTVSCINTLRTPPIEGEVVVWVSDAIGCSYSDTVYIGRSNPIVDLGADTSICAGEMVTVDAGSHAAYFWSDGSINQTLDLSAAGMYYVTVTDSIGCTKVDSIMLGINSLPVVNLGNDTSICDGTTLNIDA